MDLQNVWTVAAKDFNVLRMKKNIVYALVAFPLGMALGLPAVVWLIELRHAISFVNLFPLFNAFNFFFIIMACGVPGGIASYSIVGEKIEKSLEPLLATPTTDGEILLGKCLASFLPSIGATYFGAAVFMVGIDAITQQQLGYLFYPNWDAGVFMLLAAPLACLFSVELNVIISAKVNDVRAANQFGALLIIPFMALFVLGEINIVQLTANNLLILSAVLVLVDVFLLFVSRSTFRREEMLTKCK